MEAGCDEHSVPRHFLECHQKSTNDLKVWVIEQISNKHTEAERFHRLCERETFWIYSLDALRPGGMNEELEISTIL